jgi:hypothetical protein
MNTHTQGDAAVAARAHTATQIHTHSEGVDLSAHSSDGAAWVLPPPQDCQNPTMQHLVCGQSSGPCWCAGLVCGLVALAAGGGTTCGNVGEGKKRLCRASLTIAQGCENAQGWSVGRQYSLHTHTHTHTYTHTHTHTYTHIHAYTQTNTCYW